MTPRASSTLLNGQTDFGNVYQATHTTAGQTTPMMIAPRPFTKPAAGVMPTRPQIMPLRPPRKVGFFSGEKNMSIRIHIIMATAVHRLVLTTAAAAPEPAKYGSPPLKPFQPSHRMPPP